MGEELSAISSPSFPSSSLSDPVTSMLIEETQKGVQIYRSLNSIVDDFSIHDVWQLKPLLNGNIIRKMFSNIPDGPSMSELMHAQIHWMIEEPDGGEEGMANFLKEKFKSWL